MGTQQSRIKKINKKMENMKKSIILCDLPSFYKNMTNYEKKPKIDINKPDDKGYTALIYSICFGEPKKVENNKSLKIKNDKKKTYRDMSIMLLGHEDINPLAINTNNGWSILKYCIMAEDLVTFKRTMVHSRVYLFYNVYRDLWNTAILYSRHKFVMLLLCYKVFMRKVERIRKLKVDERGYTMWQYHVVEILNKEHVLKSENFRKLPDYCKLIEYGIKTNICKNRYDALRIDFMDFIISLAIQFEEYQGIKMNYKKFPYNDAYTNSVDFNGFNFEDMPTSFVMIDEYNYLFSLEDFDNLLKHDIITHPYTNSGSIMTLRTNQNKSMMKLFLMRTNACNPYWLLEIVHRFV